MRCSFLFVENITFWFFPKNMRFCCVLLNSIVWAESSTISNDVPAAALLVTQRIRTKLSITVCVLFTKLAST